MKKLFKGILVLFVLLQCATVASAQINYGDPKYAGYGDNVIVREKNHRNYIFFGDSMKTKRYDDAEKRLEELLIAAPACTENLYLRGGQLYRLRINQATKADKKEAYLEKLMKLYDMRNTHFGHVKARGSKVILKGKLDDFIKYNPEAIERIIKYADEAFKAAGSSVNANTVANFFNALTNAFMMDLVTPDTYLAQYELVSHVLAGCVDANAAGQLKACEGVFIQSGAADCENIEEIYKPMYLANPNDVELMKKIMAYLLLGNCESEFKVDLTENLFKVNPSTSSAYMLGMTFAKQNDYKKAEFYFLRAIELEADPIEKSKYAVRLAATFFSQKNYTSAIKYAKLSVAENNTNGLAYYILAQAYGSVSANTGCTGIAKKSVYWVIVDVLSKARTLLVDDAEQVKAINKSIASYSLHFPTTEELFFDPNIKEGNTYRVNCGLIVGTTRVRAAK